jgi:hypothetical protein
MYQLLTTCEDRGNGSIRRADIKAGAAHKHDKFIAAEGDDSLAREFDGSSQFRQSLRPF